MKPMVNSVSGTLAHEKLKSEPKIMKSSCVPNSGPTRYTVPAASSIPEHPNTLLVMPELSTGNLLRECIRTTLRIHVSITT